MLRKTMLALGIGCAALPGYRASADGMKFDYKDPKEISAVSLAIDSKLEPIFGYAKGISGIVTFDPANPRATAGSIAVDVSSIQFANDGYTATARGYALNGEKYPQILFTVKKVLRVTRPSSNVYEALVQADFTCHGITTPLTVPVTASYFPGMAEERTNGHYKGDVLVLRTRFEVSRTRQGITRGIPQNLVADKIEVRVSVVGIHYAPGQQVPGPSKDEAKPGAKSVSRAGRQSKAWQLELEDPDDAQQIDAEFDPQEPSVAFHTAKGDLSAQNVRFDGKTLMFHLPANPITGEAEVRAAVDHGTMRGTLRTAKTTLRFHGRLALAPSPDRTAKTLIGAQGPGFQALKIVAEGREWALPERMKHHHVPGLAIARIADCQVVETGYYGVTAAEHDTPVDENTLFQVGGMAGPLVNIAALRLAAAGRLDLSREANAYLKRWKIPENGFTQVYKITIADLINGTSGLIQYKFNGYPPEQPHPALIELMNGADADEIAPIEVKFVPGTQFSPAGINGVVLQILLEDVTGEGFAQLMQELVFGPLGMTHSTYEPFPERRSGYKIALGHYSSGGLMLDRYHIYPEQGKTGLWTTVADYARAVCQLQLLLSSRPNAILDPARRDLLKLVSTDKCVLGYVRDTSGYLDSSPYCYCGGDPYGYYAEPHISLERGWGVVVLQNRMASWNFRNEIVRAIAQQQGWKRPQAAESSHH